VIRGIAMDLVKQVSKKLMKGDFNLTTVSIHIRVMQPYSIIQMMVRSFFHFPIYLHLANKSNDPLEKFKLVVVGTISTYHKTQVLVKPLNPVLGETYELMYEDGSKVINY
jgi:Oxysterol-binding protein